MKEYTSPTIVPLSSTYIGALAILPLLKVVAKIAARAAIEALVASVVSKLISA